MQASPDPRRPVHDYVHNLLHTFHLQLHHTLKSQTAKNVHDLRVATRRFTQALRIFETCLGDSKTVRVRCRAMMKITGKVRDLDIAMKILRQEHGTDAADVLAGIEKQREQRAKELHRSIARMDGDFAIQPSSGADSVTEVHEAIVKAGRRLFKRAEHLSHSHDPHPLRIAAKQLRYTFELGNPNHAAVDQLAELQSELGAIHDLETVREILKKHKGAKKLLPKLEKKQHKLLQQAGRIWKRDFGAKKRRQEWDARIERFSKSLWRSVAAPKRA